MRDWFEQEWRGSTKIKLGDGLLLEAKMRWDKRRASWKEPVADPKTGDLEVYDELEPEALERVMNFARAKEDVVAVRFGTTGDKGKAPNFELIHEDGKKLSYYFPDKNGKAFLYTPGWDPSNLTKADFPVYRGNRS